MSAFALALGMSVSVFDRQSKSTDILFPVVISSSVVTAITLLVSSIMSKDKKDYDRRMQKCYGNANVNYKLKWEDIIAKMKGFVSSSVHNKKEIEKVISWTGGFYNSWYGILNGKGERSGYLPACLMISLTGPSGCGMHQFLKCLGGAMGVSNIVTIKPTDFDPESKTWSVFEQALGGYTCLPYTSFAYRVRGKLVELFSRNPQAFVIIEDFDKLPEVVINALYEARNSGELSTGEGPINIRGSMFFLVQHEVKENSFAARNGISSVTFNKPDESVYLSAVKDILLKLVSKYSDVQITYAPTKKGTTLDAELARLRYNKGTNINDLSYLAFELDNLVNNAIISGRKSVEIGIDYDKEACVDLSTV